MASVPIGPHCVYLATPLVVLTNHTPCNIPTQSGRILTVFSSPLKMEAVRSQQTFAYTDLAADCNSPVAHVWTIEVLLLSVCFLFVLLSFLLHVGGGFESKDKTAFPPFNRSLEISQGCTLICRTKRDWLSVSSRYPTIVKDFSLIAFWRWYVTQWHYVFFYSSSIFLTL